MNRLFILREPLHFDSMLAALRANWQAMAAIDKPLGVRVSVYKKTRSDEQNSLMWVWLDRIEKQAWIGDRQFDAETWHEHAKREFLPDTNNKGDAKWRYLPNGDRVCVMSTTRLDTAEMSLYMTALEAFAVGELGVELV